MNQYKRPEKELDPAKLPGQIVNRPPETPTGPKYLRDIVKRIEEQEGLDKQK